jgi:hypothetical protein
MDNYGIFLLAVLCKQRYDVQKGKLGLLIVMHIAKIQHHSLKREVH